VRAFDHDNSRLGAEHAICSTMMSEAEHDQRRFPRRRRRC
jgi:hypothetical protein